MKIEANDVKEFADEILKAVWQCPHCHAIQLPDVIVEPDRNAIRTKEKCWVKQLDQWVCLECFNKYGSQTPRHWVVDLLEYFKDEKE